MKTMIMHEDGLIKIHRRKKNGHNEPTELTRKDIMKNDMYNEKLLELPMNDVGNTRRFLLFCKDYVVYDKTVRMVSFWNGKYWEFHAEDLIMEFAIAVMEKYYEVACKAKDLSKEFQKKHKEYAKSSNNLKSLRAIFKIIKYLNYVKEIRSEPYHLNTQSGVVDLRSKKLYPHHKDFQCTSICNVRYNPDAKSKRFKRFLQEIFCNNTELINYTKQMFGYAITAENTEEKIFFLLGPGSNGKSKLINSINNVIGDYSTKIPISALTKDNKHSGTPTPELVPLINKRMAFSSELKGEGTLNDSVIKQLTGDEEILIRRMREEYIRLPIIFKIFVDANHMPYFKYYDAAIERRIVTIPFDRSFSESERDTRIIDKLHKDAEYILKWLINGAYEYYKAGGLEEPECIKNARWEFKQHSDSVGNFILDRITPKKGCDITSSSLYKKYKNYCFEKNYDPLGSKSFSQAMKKNGIKMISKRDANYFINIFVN